MGSIRSLLPSLLLIISFLATNTYGITLSSLPTSLVVVASPTPGQVLKAGEDKITVHWQLTNATDSSRPTAGDSSFKTVKIKLCYAPVSQKDRGWRKTVDDLTKDKTCQHMIAVKPFSPSNDSVVWTVAKEVPTATYFVRAYAVDAAGDEVGYGQTTDLQKSGNLFEVEGITGRHASLDIASACFSVFAVVSLFGFFYLERRRNLTSQMKS